MPIRPAVRTPVEPRLPAAPAPAADLDLDAEDGYRGLDLSDVDLAGLARALAAALDIRIEEPGSD
jgi:hypothetical protein